MIGMSTMTTAKARNIITFHNQMAEAAASHRCSTRIALVTNLVSYYALQYKHGFLTGFTDRNSAVARTPCSMVSYIVHKLG